MPAAIACKTCGQPHALPALRPGTVAHCRRCGSRIAEHTTLSLHLTAAFSLAALLLYFPANALPILRIEIYGATTDNTVWQGASKLFEDGDYAIAVIVFLASILIPLLKIIGLLTLSITTWTGSNRFLRTRTWLYKIIDAVGRWAMLDVFVVAVLVSLVKLESLATIIPGMGLLSFGGVVVCTLLASQFFDPQLIWKQQEPLS